VARVAGEVSTISDLPSPLSTVDSFGQAGGGAAVVSQASAPAGQAEPGRSVRRCHLRERKKRGLAVGPTRRGKGTKIIAVAAGNSLPLAISVQSASPAECQLVEEVLAGSFLDELPARLIGDKAYDSDALDQKLDQDYGIELIAPNRRKRSKTQDGRKLRRYRKRWKIERLFAWLHNFRRLVTRWEYHIQNFLGFVHLACLHLLLRRL
jgi:transposase